MALAAGRLSICADSSDEPLDFLCRIGEPAKGVLPCDAEVFMACLPTTPSHAGFSCLKVGMDTPRVSFILYQPWTGGGLADQRIGGTITGMERRELFDEDDRRDARRAELNERLRALGCRSLFSSDPMTRYACGRIEVEIYAGLPKRMSVTGGTPEFFDCEYAGKGDEPPR